MSLPASRERQAVFTGRTRFFTPTDDKTIVSGVVHKNGPPADDFYAFFGGATKECEKQDISGVPSTERI